MTISYLLPCSCGQKVTIDNSLAGLAVRCVCGAELNVPPMRGLAALERVESKDRPMHPAEAPKTWGPRQGLIFLGLAIVALAAAPAAYFLYTFPPAPTLATEFDELNRESLDRMSVEKTFELWDMLKKDLDESPEFPQMKQWLAIEAFYRRCLVIVGVVAVLGLVTAIVGFFFPR